MVTFPIYVLGDTASFYSVLNSVAMVFSQTGFILSVELAAGLVVLITVVASMMMRIGGDNTITNPISGPLYFAAMVAFSSLPSSALVQDIYSGSTIKVDNVPLIITVPASLFTTGAYKVFSVIDTAFSSTNGSYMSVSTSGFVMPLKMLFALRQGADKADPYLAASIKSFIIDCVPGGTADMSQTGYGSSPNGLAYLVAKARTSGMTTYYSNTNISGVAMSCADSGQQIIKDAIAFVTGSKLEKVVNGRNSEGCPNEPKGICKVSDISAAVTNVGQPNSTSAQSAQDWMTNALFNNTINDTFNCMDATGSQAASTTCNIMLTQGMEQWKADSVAQGTMFAKMMMPAIVFLQLMFFGFAPIVILYGMFKGGGGLGLYLKFIGFGVWTSSWLPFSAVIQMYIQNSVADKLTAIQISNPGVLTPYAFDTTFYDVLSTRLGLAADLLAATPMISLSLLTGSMFAMTGLASRWSGDRIDEKQASPDLQKVGAVTTVGSRSEVKPAWQGAHASIHGVGIRDALVSGHNVGTTTAINDAATAARSESDANIETLSKTVMSEFGKLVSSEASKGTSGKHTQNFLDSTGVTDTDGFKRVKQNVMSLVNGSTFSESQRQAITAGLDSKIAAGLGAGGKLGGGKLKLPIISADMQATMTKGKSAQAAQDIAKSISAINNQGFTSGEESGIVKTIAKTGSVADAYETAYGKKLSESGNQGFKTAASKLSSAQSTRQQIDSMAKGVSSNTQIDDRVLQNAIMNRDSGALQAISMGGKDISEAIGADKWNEYKAEAEGYIGKSAYLSGLQGSHREAAVEYHAMRLAGFHGEKDANVKFFGAVGALAGQSTGKYKEIEPFEKGNPTGGVDFDAVARQARQGGRLGGKANGLTSQVEPGLVAAQNASAKLPDSAFEVDKARRMDAAKGEQTDMANSGKAKVNANGDQNFLNKTPPTLSPNASKNMGSAAIVVQSAGEVLDGKAGDAGKTVSHLGESSFGPDAQAWRDSNFPALAQIGRENPHPAPASNHGPGFGDGHIIPNPAAHRNLLEPIVEGDNGSKPPPVASSETAPVEPAPKRQPPPPRNLTNPN